MRVLITGSQGALGSVVAKTFIEGGDEVVGADYAAEASFEKEGPGGFPLARFDAADSGAVRDAFETITRELGPIDALVHCAGGFRWSLVGELTDDDIDFLISANLRSSLLMLRAALAPMKERGFGRVVFVSSRTTLNPGVGEGAYAATKAGVNALVTSAAAEVSGTDVNVNAVLPTIIDTPANREAMPDADFSTWIPRERLAGVIRALTQPEMKDVNGALLSVGG